MVNWTWNIEHFEAKGTHLTLVHLVTLWKGREKKVWTRLAMNCSFEFPMSQYFCSIFAALWGFVRCGVLACRAAAGACRCPAAGASPAMGAAWRGQWAPAARRRLHNSTRRARALGGCTDQVAKGGSRVFCYTTQHRLRLLCKRCTICNQQ